MTARSAAIAVTAARSRKLERLVASGHFAPPNVDTLSRGLSILEASLHEIGHVVTMRGSLRRALKMGPVDVVELVTPLRGIVRDENEISTIAVELLTVEGLGFFIEPMDVVEFACRHSNIVYSGDEYMAHAKVIRRMKNPRCQKLARELVSYLTKDA